MIRYLKENEELSSVLESGFTLVDFYADWCGPCKMLGTVLEGIDLDVIKVNTDVFPKLAQEFGVMSIPTVVVFKNKQEVTKFIGFRSKEEIIDIINNLKK